MTDTQDTPTTASTLAAPPPTAPPPFVARHPAGGRRVSDRWSRTVLTAICVSVGITLLGVVGLLVGVVDGPSLVALAGQMVAALGVAAGRQAGSTGSGAP